MRQALHHDGDTGHSTSDFRAGGGEMGELIRSYDWSATPVGPPEQWPQSLRLTVRLMLNSQHPMFIWWGEELIQFYNDGYRKTMGPEMHPAALGARGRECWANIWHIIGPQIEYVMAGKGATWNENQMVPINRHGELQEVWWTYGYSPIDLEGEVGGVLVVCTDVTRQHLLTEELRDRTQRMARLFEEVPGFITVLRGPDHVFELANAAFRMLIGERDVIGKPAREALPEITDQDFVQLLDDVRQSGKAHVGQRTPVTFSGGAGVKTTLYLDFVYQPIVEADGTVSGIFVEGQDVTGHVEAERQLALVIKELQHRVRNILSMVSALAGQTLREAAGATAMAEFNARLNVLAAAQDALVDSGNSAGQLKDIIRLALAPHMTHNNRFAISGPPITVGSKQALSITLAIHELATNATKYGALSNDQGRIELAWWVESEGRVFHLQWRETGGPRVQAPTRTGFGSRMIKGVLAGDLGGTVDLRFDADGLQLTFSGPLEKLHVGQA